MGKSALEKFEQFCSYPLFQSVGQALPEKVSPVVNWIDAASEARSVKWENCRIEARNTLWRRIEERSWEVMHQWDEISKELMPKIGSFLKETLPHTQLPIDLQERLSPSIAWDVGFICLEEYCRDFVGGFFYLPLLDRWYAAGHFPCGWDGDAFPESWDGIHRVGKLKVF